MCQQLAYKVKVETKIDKVAEVGAEQNDQLACEPFVVEKDIQDEELVGE